MPVTTKSTEYLNAIAGGKSDEIEVHQINKDSLTKLHINKLKHIDLFSSKEAAYSFLKDRYDTIEITGTKTESISTYKFPVKIK